MARNKPMLPMLAVGLIVVIGVFAFAPALTRSLRGSLSCGELAILMQTNSVALVLGDSYDAYGTVTDDSNNPLAFTTVYWYLSYQGEVIQSGQTSTDTYGNYKITVKPWAKGNWDLSIQSEQYFTNVAITVGDAIVTVTRITTTTVGAVTQTQTVTETQTRSMTTTVVTTLVTTRTVTTSGTQTGPSTVVNTLTKTVTQTNPVPGVVTTSTVSSTVSKGVLC